MSNVGKPNEKPNRINEMFELDNSKFRSLSISVKDLKKKAENFYNALKSKKDELERIAREKEELQALKNAIEQEKQQTAEVEVKVEEVVPEQTSEPIPEKVEEENRAHEGESTPKIERASLEEEENF